MDERIQYIIEGDNQTADDFAEVVAGYEAMDAALSDDIVFDVRANLKGLQKDAAKIAAEKTRLDRKIFESEKKLQEDLTTQQRAGTERWLKIHKQKRDALRLERQETANLVSAKRLELRETEQLARAEASALKGKRAYAKEVEKNTRSMQRERKEIELTDEQVNRLKLSLAKLYQKRKSAGDPFGLGGLSKTHALEISVLDAKIKRYSDTLKAAGEDMRGFQSRHERAEPAILRFGRALATTRVHLGFFSLSVKALAAGVVTLAPVIFAAIGAISSLIGVLGTGLAGALSVGIAGLGGFGLALGGAIMAIKPFMAEAKKMVKESNLAEMFKAQTAGVRKPFLDTVAEGLKTAKALLPIFASEVTKTMGVASRETNKWLEGLRSREGKNILGDIMGNFRKALPGIMGGLGQIGAMLGRIGQSASKFLPGLTKGFEDWATNMAKSVGSGNALDQRMGRLVSHMRDVGHFAQASGRLLVTFFNSGANEGQNMLQSMTKAFNGWSKWMKGEGKESMADFFRSSREMMSHVVPMILSLGRSFAHLALAFEPVIEAAAVVGQALAGIVSAIPSSFLFAIGFVLALGKAIKTLAAPLMMLRGLAGATGLTGLLMNMIGPAAGASAGLGAVALAATGAGVAATALGVGLYFGLRGIEDSIPLHEVLSNKTAELETRTRAAAKANDTLAAANKTLNQVLEDRNATAAELAQASREQWQAENRQKNAVAAQKTAVASAKGAWKEYLSARRAVAEAESKGNQQVRGTAGLLASTRAEMERTRPAAERYQLALINLRRAQHGLAQLQPQMASQMAAFRRNFGGKQTMKLSLSGGKQAVGEISRLANQLTGLNRRRTAIKILANTEGADNQVRQLRRAVDNATKKEHKLRIRLENQGRTKTEINQLDRDATKTEKPRKIPIRADASQAKGEISSVKAELAGIPDEEVNINVNVRRHYSGGVGAGIRPGGWSGGEVAARANGGASRDRLDRAAERAAMVATLPADRGAEIRRPTFVAGELANDREWVITDNNAWRKSNVGYLSAAADALGMIVIPAAAKGNANRQAARRTAGARKRLKNAPSAATPLGNWKFHSAEQQFWADEYDLDRRSYDAGTGTGGIIAGYDKPSLIGDLDAQINHYTAMRALIPQISSLTKLPEFKVPSGAKGKRKKKANKVLATTRAYNEDVDSVKGEMSGMTQRGIDQLIAGLQQEKLEIDLGTTSGTALAAQGFSAAQQRYLAFSQYASNIGIGPLSPFSGGSAAPGAPVSPATPGYSTASSISSLAGGTAAAPGGGSGNISGATVINNFQAPPPDPHTWANQQAFELAAM